MTQPQQLPSAVLNALAFLHDFVDPTVTEAVRDSWDGAYLDLQLLILRENLGWLDLGIQSGYFALDETAQVHARLAVDYYVSVAGGRENLRLVELEPEAVGPIWTDFAQAQNQYLDRSLQWMVLYRRALNLIPSYRDEPPFAVTPGASQSQVQLETRSEFELRLEASIASATPGLMQQIYLVYLCPEYEWRPWGEGLLQMQSPAARAMLHTARGRTDYDWALSEGEVINLEEHSPLLPSHWRCAVPWRAPTGLEGLNLHRRSQLFDFLLAAVEGDLAEEDLSADEVAQLGEMSRRLRSAGAAATVDRVRV